MNKRPNTQAMGGVAAFLTAGLLAASTANAATITMDASDAFGVSSFNAGTNWTGNAAPIAGNDYSTNGFTLRTPANTSSHTFAGDSLTVTTGSSFSFKGTSSSATITVGSLILDGGSLATIITSDFHLAGGLSVTGNGGMLNSQDKNLYVDSVLSGSGALSVIDSNGATNGSNTVFFTNGSNTYNGTLTVGNSFNLTSTGKLNFAIGANGVNNSVMGAGTAAFDGIFAFDLSGAASSGSWTIVDISTLNESFTGTFIVEGWTDNGDDTWGSGTYTFSELTGLLTTAAIPEPSTYAMLTGALALGFVAIGRRRRNS